MKSFRDNFARRMEIWIRIIFDIFQRNVFPPLLVFFRTCNFPPKRDVLQNCGNSLFPTKLREIDIFQPIFYFFCFCFPSDRWERFTGLNGIGINFFVDNRCGFSRKNLGYTSRQKTIILLGTYWQMQFDLRPRAYGINSQVMIIRARARYIQSLSA